MPGDSVNVNVSIKDAGGARPARAAGEGSRSSRESGANPIAESVAKLALGPEFFEKLKAVFELAKFAAEAWGEASNDSKEDWKSIHQSYKELLDEIHKVDVKKEIEAEFAKKDPEYVVPWKKPGWKDTQALPESEVGKTTFGEQAASAEAGGEGAAAMVAAGGAAAMGMGEVAAAAVGILAPIAIVAAGLWVLKEAIEKVIDAAFELSERGKKLALGYGGPASGEAAMSEVRDELRKIREAQQLGTQYAELIRATDNVQDNWQSMVEPIKEFVIGALAEVMQSIAVSLKITEYTIVGIEKILKLISALLTSGMDLMTGGMYSRLQELLKWFWRWIKKQLNQEAEPDDILTRFLDKVTAEGPNRGNAPRGFGPMPAGAH